MVKLQANDPFVIVHDNMLKLLDIMVTYDQLAVTALASAEYIVRQIQMVEERYKDKVFGHAGEQHTLETNLFSGAMHRSGLCICPALSEWIATELRGESAILKERRKAWEERTLAEPKS